MSHIFTLSSIYYIQIYEKNQVVYFVIILQKVCNNWKFFVKYVHGIIGVCYNITNKY